MPKLLVIQHAPTEGLGAFEEEMKANNLTWDTIKTYESAQFPGGSEFDGYAGLISLGGPMGANDESTHPWIAKELMTMGEFLRQKKPILGICLGAQLLARASGGKAYRGSKKEIGWYPVKLDEWFSHRNPLFFQFERGKDLIVFQWHGDTVDKPSEGYTLCWNENYPQQAFSFQGNAIGLQFHPEMTEAMIREWVEAGQAEIKQAGLDPQKILSESKQHLPELKKIGHRIFYGFASLIRDNRRQAA